MVATQREALNHSIDPSRVNNTGNQDFVTTKQTVPRATMRTAKAMNRKTMCYVEVGRKERLRVGSPPDQTYQRKYSVHGCPIQLDKLRWEVIDDKL